MCAISLSLSGAAARVHTAGMTSKAAFSALRPVDSVADTELFTITHAENLKTTAAGSGGVEVIGRVLMEDYNARSLHVLWTSYQV